MSLKLTKAEQKQRDEHVANLRLCEACLTSAVEEFNTSLSMISDELRKAHMAHAVVLRDVRDWHQELVGRLEGEMENRSDKWLDSDAGATAQEWLNGWSSADLDEVELEYPDEIEVPELEQAQQLEELDAEPEED